MNKTPLRYPGGKSRALKSILPHVPSFQEYREPFVGGASVYIHLKQVLPKREYWINDINTDLYCFWSALQNSADELVARIKEIKVNEKDGKALHKKMRGSNPSSTIDKAVKFFVLNRISFSGTTESGGYSSSSFEDRFTYSSIQKLHSISHILQGTQITNNDYEEVVKKKGEDVFLFLDPPYFLNTKSMLYGKNGELHKNFSHSRFAEVMREVKHKWMITYDDCEEVRSNFSYANIVNYELQYGMNNYKQKNAKKGQEIIITNYEVSAPMNYAVDVSETVRMF